MNNLMDIPVIKTFVKNCRYYLYSAYFNRLYEIDKSMYEEIGLLLKIGVKAYISGCKKNELYGDIRMLIDKGVLKCAFIENIEHPLTIFLPQLLKRRVAGMTFQVTKRCNFDCRYCVIASKNEMIRTHMHEDMSWDIAKKSIDYLYTHSKDVTAINVAFYGGEPMLNYKLIVDIVNYMERRFITKTIRYMMTINGSVLSEEMIKFLSFHQFDIAVSLDGPKEIQNRHRVFASNGNGTFDVVYNNVLKIKEIDRDYYYEHVTFMPVVFRDEIINNIKSFFGQLGKAENEISKLDVSLNGIDYYYSENVDFTNKGNLGYNREKSDNNYTSVYNDKRNLPSKWHHNGPCVPTEKMLINTDGSISICEKAENVIIGDISQGIKLESVKECLNIGKLTGDDCKNCWALRFCSLCVMDCADMTNGKMNIDRKVAQCKQIKRDVLSFFKRCIINNDLQGE